VELTTNAYLVPSGVNNKCAKASKSERNMGCEELEEKTTDDGRKIVSDTPHQRGKTLRSNFHPTVKPIALMEYLIKLVTPPKGIVLDPFLGSGTTALAAKNLGFNYIGIEKEPEYVKIAEARLNKLNK
jgi:site-specific DNA-methyltransferase (adenine-specific)